MHDLDKRRVIVSGIFCVITWAGCATTTDLIANRFFLPNDGVREPSHGVWTERGIGFTTSDSIRLLADIHHPKTRKKTPTILVRIPFTNTFRNRTRSDVIGRYWARRGYTVVIQGTRGRYESGGQFYPLTHEREDGKQTLRWIANQPWYDGRLAMWGGSAFGHTQWAIADQTNPGPSALFVQIASTNFRKMFYPGNAFSLESGLYWAVRSRGGRDREVVSIKDIERGVASFPIIEADDRAIGDTDFFNDWLLNQHNDAYWEAIDGTNRTHSLQAPVLLMAGWFDPFLPTQINDFTNILNHAKDDVASETRLIIGPWAHARDVILPDAHQASPYRRESIVPSITWFDYQLSMSKDPLNMSRVKIFVMGENRWRDENEWPLARTQYTSFYLHSNGAANSLDGDGLLNTAVPKGEETPDTYTYNPLDPVPSAGGAMLGPRSGVRLQNTIESRYDILVYTTTILSDPVEVTGPVSTILYVSTDVPSTDFTAKLVDVHPDGRAYNVCDGILRRDYKPTQNSEKIPVKIDIDLWPTSHVFQKGHRIKFEISSSNFPRFDRNTNTGAFMPTASETVTANQTIFHSRQYPSRLILPIIPRPQ
ncbi:MAG: CocE/NonD family hydrolase [Candidatus Latescibacterota bacterium]|nr:CocE/NonD family hydrolase [Candidatus Latescibacterota bacterium]